MITVQHTLAVSPVAFKDWIRLLETCFAWLAGSVLDGAEDAERREHCMGPKTQQQQQGSSRKTWERGSKDKRRRLFVLEDSELIISLQSKRDFSGVVKLDFRRDTYSLIVSYLENDISDHCIHFIGG